MIEGLPIQLQSHRQLERASCAASGFECIAKLNGLIAPDTFPLQSDPANQGMGFGDTGFLHSLGLKTSDKHLGREAALDCIEAEIRAEKFPLVSLLVAQTDSGRYWHIYICVQHDGKLLLIDPAIPRVQAQNRDGLTAEFQRTLDLAPDRQLIHVMTYAK